MHPPADAPATFRCNYVVGSTYVVCNPFGYARVEENARFDEKKIIEL